MFEKTGDNLTALTHGAFLVTGKDDANVMTIGWGFYGYMWKKKVFIAPIRESRYTRELLDKNGTFTVSFPKEGEYKAELAFTGSKSGRDVDKFESLGLKKVDAPLANSYAIEGCDYIECRIIGKSELDTNLLGDTANTFYKDGDMHILYYGEILEK